MKSLKKCCVLFILVTALTISVAQVSIAKASDLPKQDQLYLFLKNVAGLDTSKYQVNLATSLPSNNQMLYHFNSEGSKLDISCEFRNNTLVCCLISQVSGSALLAQSPTDDLGAAKRFLVGYQDYSKASYVQQMRETLNSVTELKNESSSADYGTMKKVLTRASGNTTLTVWMDDYGYVLFDWMNVVNGIKNPYNRLGLGVQNGIFEQFADDWNLYSVGCAEMKVSKEEAVGYAVERLKIFSYSVGDTVVGNLVVAKDFPASAEVSMQPRGGLLYPHWEIYLPLDKMYLGQVTSVRVMMWADTGEIDSIQAASTLGDPSEGSTALTSEPSAQPENNTLSFSAEVDVVVCVAVATAAVAGSVLVLRRRKR
jgi:hypothetical protein